MEEIIQINDHNGQSVVSARELHTFLESKREFSTWIKQRIQKYGFVENEDYTSFDEIVKREKGAATRTEYALTLDTAKELAMVEANDKGRQARRYFIEQEKKLRELEHSSLTPQIQTINAPSININSQEALDAVSRSAAHKVMQYLESLGIVTLPEDPMDKYYSVSEYIREVKQIRRFFSKWDILEISRGCKNLCEDMNYEIIIRPSEKWSKGINTYPGHVLIVIVGEFLEKYPD